MTKNTNNRYSQKAPASQIDDPVLTSARERSTLAPLALRPDAA